MPDTFNDAVAVWMALITERERLQNIVNTKRVTEPVFGAPVSHKQLTDEEVAQVEQSLVRVKELVDLAFERREKLGAVFTNEDV